MKRQTIYKIGLRLLLLIALLIAFNYIYTRFFYEKDLQEHSDLINLVRDVQYKSDVIYIGESSNITFGDHDVYPEWISGFIADHYPDLRFGTINKPAAHSGIYKVMLEQLPENDTNIKVVIVTMNLRSFGADWIYSYLETALQKSTVLLRTPYPLYNRFILSFKGYDIKSDKERDRQRLSAWGHDKLKFPQPFPYDNVNAWDHAVGMTGILDSAGNWNEFETQLACHFIKNYAFQIDTLKNPRIHDFNDIVKLAQKRKWKLVFNLLPENTVRGEQLAGKELLWLIRQNRDLLVDYYTRKGVTVVDNLEVVDSADYIDKNWPTEHYADRGRAAVAQNVANALKTFYPNKYKDVSYHFGTRSHYFFNGEGNEQWYQMQTLTTEKAYSGKKSSKIGGSEPYGLTFYSSVKGIPDSCLNKVQVTFRFWAEKLDKNVALVVQYEGKDIKIEAEGTPLLTPQYNPNQWMLFEHVFDLSPDTRKAKDLKVYIHNPTQNILYMDDLDIQFE